MGRDICCAEQQWRGGMLAFRVCRARVATLLELDILRCLHSDFVQAKAVRYIWVPYME